MANARTTRIPSLSWLCVRWLSEFPDEIYHIPFRLRVPESVSDSDHRISLAKDIADAVHDGLGDDYNRIDPRLWATLVQIYDNLPSHLANFSISLGDPHIPLLQRIPATPRFALLTLLDLPACAYLTDDSITELTPLHSLVALDVSATSLSSYAVTVLSRTLQWSGNQLSRGLWGLRILRLRDCVAIENSVYPPLARFPLLSVIDLRGTKCTPTPSILHTFRPADTTQLSLYHPAPLYTALQALSSPNPLYASPHVFALHINSLYNEPPPALLPQPTVAPQDTFVVTPCPKSHYSIMLGHSEALRRCAESAEELSHREENKKTRNPQYNTGHHLIGPRTREATSYFTDYDVGRRSLLHKDEALNSPSPISRSTYLSHPPKHKHKASQHPTTSILLTLNPVLSNTQPAQKDPTSLALSSWIGNPHIPLCTRKPLKVSPIPQSPLSGSGSSISLLQRPLISPSTAAFYSAISTNPRASHHAKLYGRASSRGYSAEKYYSETHQYRQGEHDATLMLYRPPPPWNGLSLKAITSRSTYGKRADVLADGGILRLRHVESISAKKNRKRIEVVGEKEGGMQAAHLALQESAKRYNGVSVSAGRRGWCGDNAIGATFTRSDNTDTGTTVKLGKNPFRRHTAVGIDEIVRQTTRPLKPISAVKIPFLPKSVIEEDAKRRKTVLNMKTSNSNAAIETVNKLRVTRAPSRDEKGAGQNVTVRTQNRSKATATPSKGTGTSHNWSKWGFK
ncbi:hypothetical protein BDZ94DRAFT_1296968 [Collybia nuda]|uniref:Uncharacterized protein n=1 Tax=Collybia nuda TaxID=64659 RepID=A0A9P5Y6Y1_9AGAR|nr:hypothetical protein BDZ94DRAFT_1296968 [Collybia nuda]